MTARLETELTRIRRWVRGEMAALQARLAYWAPSSVTTSDGTRDTVKGRPQSDGDYDFAAPRIQHAGFRSRVAAGSDNRVCVPLGGGTTTHVSVAEDDGQGASVPLDNGEAAVYSPAKPGCRAWFDKDGTLHLDAYSGQNIVLNGGAVSLARNGDDVALSGAMQTWMNNVALGISAGGGGSLTPLVGTTIGTVTGTVSRVKG